MAGLAVLGALVLAGREPARAEPGASASAAEEAPPDPRARSGRGTSGIKARVGPADLVPLRREVPMGEQAARKADEEIARIGKLVGELPPADPRQPELLFRLAERWFEKARRISFAEIEAYDVRYRAFLEAKRRGDAAAVEPVLETPRANQARAEALRLYQQILDRHPSYSRSDEVLFDLAYTAAITGQPKLAGDRYGELIRRYPQSPLVPDAYLEVGEQYFAAGDLTRARAAYQQAREGGVAQIQDYARYKLAWCDFDAGDATGALRELAELVKQAANPDLAGRAELRQEALRDSVRILAARGAGAEEAMAYWSAGAREDERAGLLRVFAAQLLAAGRLDEAARAFRLLTSSAAAGPELPRDLAGLVQVSSRMGRWTEVGRELARLLDATRPESDWSRAQAEPARAAARALAERTLREQAAAVHAEAQRSHSTVSYRIARDLYRALLEGFQPEGLHQLRFDLAQVCEALGDLAGAAASYAEASRQAPAGDPLVKEAAYRAVVAAQKALGPAERTDGGTPSPAELRLLEACDRFVEVAPSAPEQLQVRYVAAQIAARAGPEGGAEARLAELAARWPSDPLARKAAGQLLERLAARRDWAELEKQAGALVAQPALAAGHPELAERLGNALQGARFELALSMSEKAPAGVEAAEAFSAFARDFPASPHVATALFDAAVIQERRQRLDLASGLLEQALRGRGSAEVGGRALRMLAAIHLRTGDVEAAAREDEQLADGGAAGPRGRPRAREAAVEVAGEMADRLAEAAALYEALGDDGRAVACWAHWLEAARERPQAVEVALHLGQIEERRNEPGRAAAVYGELARRRGADPALAWRGRALAELARRAVRARPPPGWSGRAAALVGEYRRLSATSRADPALRDAAARLAFEQAEVVQEDAASRKLSDPRRLANALKEKLAALARAEEAYRAVIALEAPGWAIAALVRIGMGYQDLAGALAASGDPRGLDPEQLRVYREVLAEQARGVEGKAAAAYEQSIAKSRELAIYDGWTVLAVGRLSRLRQAPPLPRPVPLEPSRPSPSGDPEEAAAALRAHLARTPEDPEALHDLALLEHRRGRLRLARFFGERALESASRSSRDTGAIENDLGVFAAALDDPGAARVAFEKAAAGGLTLGDRNLGTLALGFGDWPAASKALAQAAAHEPDRWPTRLALAQALEQEVRIGEARVEAERVAASVPAAEREPEIAALLARLQAPPSQPKEGAEAPEEE
jgi:Tfp pilus assembly protein PilF/TolA-binding protein